MNETLTALEREALAVKAIQGISDQALVRLVEAGGISSLRAGVQQVHERVTKMGTSLESLVALSLLAQAYMDERRANHERQQRRVPLPLRRSLTERELYPVGFSMEQALAQARVPQPKEPLSPPAAPSGAAGLDRTSPTAPVAKRQTRGP